MFNFCGGGAVCHTDLSSQEITAQDAPTVPCPTWWLSKVATTVVLSAENARLEVDQPDGEPTLKTEAAPGPVHVALYNSPVKFFTPGIEPEKYPGIALHAAAAEDAAPRKNTANIQQKQRLPEGCFLRLEVGTKSILKRGLISRILSLVGGLNIYDTFRYTFRAWK